VEHPLFAPKQSFAVPDLDDAYAPIPAVRTAVSYGRASDSPARMVRLSKGVCPRVGSILAAGGSRLILTRQMGGGVDNGGVRKCLLPT
jgi:hypothetical protein